MACFLSKIFCPRLLWRPVGGHLRRIRSTRVTSVTGVTPTARSAAAEVRRARSPTAGRPADSPAARPPGRTRAKLRQCVIPVRGAVNPATAPES